MQSILESDQSRRAGNYQQWCNWNGKRIYLNAPDDFIRPPPPAKKLHTIGSKISGSQRRHATRLGLPLRLNARDGPATVLACPDSGSEENIIAEDLARLLGYTDYEAVPLNKQFLLANGKIVESKGQIITYCWFGKETDQMSTPMACSFYVLSNLVSPLILGMEFLEKTKTLTEHRDRLVRVPARPTQVLQVCSVGRPRNHLLCHLDEELTLAVPDSGSEVNLMSPRFASERSLQVQAKEELIQMADGSLAVTSGSLQVNLAVRDPICCESTLPKQTIVLVEFLLLEDLTHDILIGEHSLDKLKVFTESQHSLLAVSDATGPARLNRIRHFGAIDRALAWVVRKLGSRTAQQRANSQYTAGKYFCPDVNSPNLRRFLKQYQPHR